MEVDPFPGKAVEVGRLEPGSAVAGDVAPAHVVGVDEDDVRGRGGWGCIGRDESGERGEQEGGVRGKAHGACKRTARRPTKDHGFTLDGSSPAAAMYSTLLSIRSHEPIFHHVFTGCVSHNRCDWGDVPGN